MEINVEKLKERELVVKKIEEFESKGVFDQDVENDAPSKPILPNQIDYLRKKTSSKIKTAVYNHIASKFINNLIKNNQLIIKEIIGLNNLADIKTGAIITCNHFNICDNFAIQKVYEKCNFKHKKLFKVIKEGNYVSMPGFFGKLMKHCNTFPLSSNSDTMKKFLFSMEQLLKKGHLFLVYPEQSMWWNYKKPRPLKSGAFKFATTNKVPVVPCFITFNDSNILSDDGSYIQEYTINIGKPIYPDSHLTNKENIENMKQKNFEIWKEIYETTYNTKLSYNIKD